MTSMEMELPFVEVSHLASSTSFYSSVLQPLGLRYLSVDRENPSSVGTVTYGHSGPASAANRSVPVLQIRETAHPFAQPNLSTLVLAAPSPAAVADFHASAFEANPELHLQALQGDGDVGPTHPCVRSRLGGDGGVLSPTRTVVHDLDGNALEVVFAPQDSGFAVPWGGGGSNSRSIVLDWIHDDFSPPATRSHYRTRSQSQPHPISSPRSSTSSLSLTQAPIHAPTVPAMSTNGLEDDDYEPTVSPRQSSSGNGLSTTAVLGTLLGVAAGAAAGAAFTYGMVNKERDRRPRQEIDRPPTVPRRSTFPDRFPPTSSRPYDESGPPPHPDFRPQMLPYRPAGNHVPPPPLLPAYRDDYHLTKSPRAVRNGGYTPRKIAFPDEPVPVGPAYEDDEAEEYLPREHERRSTRYLTQHSHHEKPPRSVVSGRDKTTPKSKSGRSSRSQAVDDSHDTRSRRSSRHSSSRTPKLRSRSEVAPERTVFAPSEHQSRPGSRHTKPPKSTYSVSRSHRHQHDGDNESYVSARSRRSSAVLDRRPPIYEVEPELPRVPAVPDAPVRGSAGSRSGKIRYSVDVTAAPTTPEYGSKAHSYVSTRSARNIALPGSGVGSSHADWDDDMESVAPSDSISCVGSRTSRRSRRAKA